MSGQAACQAPGVDPLWFYAERGDVRRSNRARQICAGCGIRMECLRAAVERREKYGIWGGVSFSSSKGRRIRREMVSDE